MDHIDIIDVITDFCDSETALNVLSLTKNIRNVLSFKLPYIQRRLRYEAARDIVRGHVQELPGRINCAAVSGFMVIEYMLCMTIMVSHQRMFLQDGWHHEYITILPKGYGIIKAPENYIAFVSYKRGMHLNLDEGIIKAARYFRPCLYSESFNDLQSRTPLVIDEDIIVD